MKKMLLFAVIIFTQITCSAQPVKDWKLGIQLWTFHITPFFNALNRVDSCGLQFIEIYPGQKLSNNTTATIGPSLTSEERVAIKKIIKAKGITIVAYGVVACNKVEEWKTHFEFAKDMGIAVITAEPAKEHLDIVNKLAGEYKIKVAIHDHPKPSQYWHPDSVLAAIKNRPNIGVCADIGHWVRNDLNVIECLKKLKGYIISLHLKDVIEYNKIESPDVLLGTGICNIPAVLKELKQQNFKGFFSIEHEINWATNVQDVIKNKQYYLQQIKKL